MILAATDDRIRFVTQPDHAALAGRFAEAWGGEAVDAPTPKPAVRLAVHAHDDGWWPRDRRPRLKPDGTPYDFYEIPAAQWMRLQRRGVDAVARADPYAGLLVSLHAAGLRRQRYGLSPSWPETPRAFRGFVEREQRRQRSLATALREDDTDDRLSVDDSALITHLHDAGEPPSEVFPGTARDPHLWRNYRLLSALDALSLRICATPTRMGSSVGSWDGEERCDDEGSNREGRSDGAQTDPGAVEVAPIEIPHVPTRPGEPDTTLSATPCFGDSWRIDPYPFDRSPVTVHVPTRTVDSTSFQDERTLFDRYYAAEIEEITVTMRPA
ncbi:DUF3891 family protein [Halorubrum vacuolatum]|uniref:DUF3891 domain-containing protein n=1 Tax=Halorubrum vacuolatum TaxID=63740 RepID=A0A238VLZ6_HALVU|nr:DUF3891 family protein [Halorubrum vacuolatum]SNR35256.1 Protein of unknown function [Halorubrum vacuolatum]